MHHAKAAFGADRLLSILALALIGCSSPPHRSTIPFATVHAGSPELAKAFSVRVQALRQDVLSVLPHASPNSTYDVRVLDPETYDEVRFRNHAGGQIFKSPFSDHSRITIPADAPDAVIAHELVHAHRSSFWRPLTRYMEEGLADHIADNLDPSASQYAKALVYLGFYYRVPCAEYHTFFYRYANGGWGSEMSRSNLAGPPPELRNFDPLRTLAAPREWFDLPHEARKSLLRYSVARVVMKRAILHDPEAPFVHLGALCEKARATRAGVLDAAEVFALAGFSDTASFRTYVKEHFQSAWLNCHFPASRILDLILEFEAECDLEFSSPAHLFEHVEVRYLPGNHAFRDVGPEVEDFPGFRDHFVEHWPAPELLRDARSASSSIAP